MPLADFRLTHLHEEEAGTGRGVVIHVDVCKDGCCQQDHHYEDSHQQTHRRCLIGVCVLPLSCCTQSGQIQLIDLNVNASAVTLTFHFSRHKKFTNFEQYQVH